MKFPLDFIWKKGDTIVDITEKVKPENFQPPYTIFSKKKLIGF
ncbi:MAG: hypothetical protein ACP5H7_02140 [Minisyncoccia bacterium]